MEIQAVLEQLIDRGDITDIWIKIFHKYIATVSVDCFIDTLREQLVTNQPKPDIVMRTDVLLTRFMEMFIDLESHTKSIVNGVPANWKAHLVRFKVSEQNNAIEGDTTWTFRYRNNSSPQLC